MNSVWENMKLDLLLLFCALVVSSANKGQIPKKRSNYEIVFPEKVDKRGNFISYEIPHYYHYSDYSDDKKRNVQPSKNVNYKLSIDGNDHLLELHPNTRFVSPGMVIETRHDFESESGSAMDIKRLQDTLCHYRGYLRDQENSLAAVSTCNGLAGFISMNDESYFIEPLTNFTSAASMKRPHIIYKDDSIKLKDSNVCASKGGVKDALANRLKREGRAGSVISKKFEEESKPLFLETLVVLDKSFIDYHKNLDVENYALTVFNMAHTLFDDASLGVSMELVLVRMIKLEADSDEMNAGVSKSAEKTLEAFCTWQNKVNPIDDSHPNHHDLAVLLTRVDICAEGDTCGVLGLSKIGGTCDPLSQCNICEDSGLKLGYVITHEIGHSLGMDHDDPQLSGCNGTISADKTTVMSSEVRMTVSEWSQCSQDYLRTFLDMGFGDCLQDEPGEHEFNIADLLPGVVYGGDYQCHHIVDPAAKECKSGLTCDSLNCEMPGYGCIHTNVFPAPGTKCGEKKWCYQRKCLSVGQRPGAVDGGWGQWQEWSECSRTCGTGVTSVERLCNNPHPKNGGRFCIGERKRYKICSHKPCEQKVPTFRDLQCAKYNDWVYPEDLKRHKWKAYHMHNDNPCALHCINEDRVLLEMNPRAVDGSACYRGLRDICIAGVCREIPCDLDLNSQAIEDVCGACHGDGTSCDLKEGTIEVEKDPKNPKVIVELPKYSRNIRIQEMEPSKARILVMDTSQKTTYSKGKEFGEFSVPGSKGWLGMVKLRQESIHIPGPIDAGLLIMALAFEGVPFMYTYGVKPEKTRQGEYHWNHVEWSRCSAECGRGIQKSNPYCMEKIAGRVDDKYCAKMKMPEAKTKECILAPCLPRWAMSDWSNCTCKGGKIGERARLVECLRPEGEGEGQGVVLPESLCPQPKPRAQEKCNCPRASRSIDKAEAGEDDGNCTEIEVGAASGNKTIQQGQIVKDVEDVSRMNMTLVSSKTGKNQTLEGKEALLFLKSMHQNSSTDHSHNRTKHSGSGGRAMPYNRVL
ncbi:A disintegrin and metalloproteinase with thrombospondin motifs 12-like isoform X2 [Ischnura elegans]|uniref:A disintegrin and metalloproteinase with thrombospondin motifs 12-like isoform X2 n=1 Tax=Ischnura elegans TaxID=197161 RepID=UPI001ED87848|nr:A disintegrin and metalloproteinase with thrombospondin motifs 12-like isoform X2 [Ischnura elegans]